MVYFIDSMPGDEDLFQALSVIKDSSGHRVHFSDHSLQVPSHSNHSLLTPQPRSVVGSETDVLLGDHAQFKSLEGGSISLGDQFTECNQVCILYVVFFQTVS